MPHVTSYRPGQFSWVDLATTDPGTSRDFYTALFGWDYEDEDAGGGIVYTTYSKDGLHVAGMGAMPDAMRDAGVPSMWQSYVTVDDADAAGKRAVELGGATPMGEAFDVMDAGRMAVVIDPQGAMFRVWQPRDHIGAQLVNEPGSFCWNELLTTDANAAEEFYAALFGWKFTTSDTDGMTYTEITNDGDVNGGIMAHSEEMGPMPAHWGVYFAVSACDESVARVAELGGGIHVPPTDIPPGRFAVVSDPVGAVFDLIELDLEM
ncbi:MAG: VOC family protein [Acidimicrobiia bacterium]|nr:VOC family protein [Acidimicrobiia bacterium]